MTVVSTTIPEALVAMKDTFAALAEKLRELGINLAIWDAQCNRALTFEPASTFCGLLPSGSTGGCDEAIRELVGRVIAQGRPDKSSSRFGCCFICVPIHQRRRVIGAAAACFPTRDLLDDEVLARMCDRLEMDREVLAKASRSALRHSADEADDFLRILEGLLKHEQEARIAREELKSLSDNLASTYEELSLLYRISGSMEVTHQLGKFLKNVCEELLEVMRIAAVAAVVYPHPPSIDDCVVELTGQIDLDSGQIQQLIREHLAGRLSKSKRTILENNFSLPDGQRFSHALRNIIAVPLMSNEESMGVLIGFNKINGDFDSVDSKLISSIGNQVSIFLANNKLYADLQDLLMGVLHALTASIDAKDPYTCGHSQRVALISRRLAEDFGFTPEKVQQVYLAGVLHDIGKIGVPESALCKPGKLTDEEFENVKRHPAIGAKILGGIRQLEPVIPSILSHHERLDGKGYPQGLAGSDIPIEALIVGLADSFDAMTSDRTYRRALPLDTVTKEIRKCSGTQFHPQLVERFLSMDIEKFMEEIRRPAKAVFSVQESGI